MKSIGKLLGIMTAATLLSSFPVMASDGSQVVTNLLKDNPEFNANKDNYVQFEQQSETNKNNIGNYKESEFIKEMYIREEKRGELPVNWYLHPYDLDDSFYKPWSGLYKRIGVPYRTSTKTYVNKGYTFTTDINPDAFTEINTINAAATIEAITAKAKRLITPEMKELSEPQKLQVVMDLVSKNMSYDYAFKVSTSQCHLQKINEGLGTCVDFSLLTLYLCDEIGLKEPGVARVIVDNSHTFNFVDINGIRTYFDPTAVATSNNRQTFTDPIDYVKTIWGKKGWGFIYTVEVYDSTIATITGAEN